MLRPRATRTPGTMRAVSRARAATMRAAIRMVPRLVVCRVYQTSRTRTRIWLMTDAVRPGGAGTGVAASSVTGSHRAASSLMAAWQWTHSRWWASRLAARPSATCSSRRSTSAPQGSVAVPSRWRAAGLPDGGSLMQSWVTSILLAWFPVCAGPGTNGYAQPGRCCGSLRLRRRRRAPRSGARQSRHAGRTAALRERR